MYVCMCVCLAFEMIVLGDKLLVTLVTPAFPKRAVTRSIQQTEKDVHSVTKCSISFLGNGWTNKYIRLGIHICTKCGMYTYRTAYMYCIHVCAMLISYVLPHVFILHVMHRVTIQNEYIPYCIHVIHTCMRNDYRVA